jgi:hypothetical protein
MRSGLLTGGSGALRRARTAMMLTARWNNLMTDDQQVAPVRDRPRGGGARGRLPVHGAHAALIAIGVGVALESVSLGLWTRLGPGPGLLPLLLGVMLVGLAAIWAVQSLLAVRAATTPRPTLRSLSISPTSRW